MITIHGYDEYIAIEGALRGEFYATQHRIDGEYIACSDGTLIRALCVRAIWQFTVLHHGQAEVAIMPNINPDVGSDVVTLRGDIRWIVHGGGAIQA